jgi:RNA recognition motif-containing protein
MGKKVYIANISCNATEQDINDLFSDYGEVESVKIITERVRGQSRGFGFIEMETEEDAKRAISDLNGTPFMGKELSVSQAKPQQSNRDSRERKDSFSAGRRGAGKGSE